MATIESARIKLGDIARDSVTGYQGMVMGMTDWLYGCRRITLQAQTLHDGRPVEAVTFDEPQLVRMETRLTPAVGDAPGGPRPEPQRRETPRR